MNILMILENPYPPDERVENEIAILTKKGFNISLICAGKEKKFRIERNGNLVIYRIPLSNFIYKSSAVALLFPVYFLFWYTYIRKIIKKSSFDAIHLHDLPLIKVGLKLSKEFNIPIVADYHENRPEIMKMYRHTQTFPGKYLISTKKWMEYQLNFTKLADRLILVTDEAKDYYVSNYGVDPGKIIVLPNYISLERFGKLAIPGGNDPVFEKRFTVAYFGDTGLRRGTLTILESAEILKENRTIHFIIIGDSREQEELLKFATDHNLKNVAFTGWIPVAEALNHISVSDVGLCPFLRNIHHDTTYANKMFQYLALGKPVIVSNCTAQANFVEKENCGLIFEAGNAQNLADQIINLMNKETFERLSNNGRSCVYNRYNWETFGTRLTDLYSSLKKRSN